MSFETFEHKQVDSLIKITETISSKSDIKEVCTVLDEELVGNLEYLKIRTDVERNNIIRISNSFQRNIEKLPPAMLQDKHVLGLVQKTKLLLNIHTAQDVNALNEKGVLLLESAAKMGHIAAVRLLVNTYGANPNKILESGFSILERLLRDGDENAAFILIENGGASVDKNALHHAVQGKCYKIIPLCITRGADVNARDKNGDTPLHRAMEGDQDVGLMEMLLKFKANPNSSNNKSETPFIVLTRLPSSIDSLQSSSSSSMPQGGVGAKRKLEKGDMQQPLEKKEGKFRDSSFLEIFEPFKCEADALIERINTISKSDNKEICVVLEGLAESLEGLKMGTDAERNKMMSIYLNFQINMRKLPSKILKDHAVLKLNNKILLLLDIHMAKNVNEPNKNGVLLLESAVEMGYINGVRLLVNTYGADPNILKGGVPLLGLFLKKRNLNQTLNQKYPARILIEIGGASVKFGIKKDNKDALHYLVEGGHDDIISLCVARGADVNARDSNGDTPMHLAADEESDDLIGGLAEHKADVNSRNNKGQTPLHVATLIDLDDYNAAMLCDLNADLNVRDNKGTTPLINLVNKDTSLWDIFFGLIQRLLDKGANPKIKDNTKKSALSYVKKALKEGLEPKFIGSFERYLKPKVPPVSVQSSSSSSARTKRKLKDVGERKEGKQNKQRKTVDNPVVGGGDNNPSTWHNGSWVGPRIFPSILNTPTPYLPPLEGDKEKEEEGGADVNARDSKGNTPIHLAVMYGERITFIKSLVEHGADINGVNNEGETPLHVMLSRYVSVDIVRKLLQLKPKLNVRNNEGNTPLMNLIINENSIDDCAQLFRLLIESGADTTIRNNEGYCALDLAKNEGFEPELIQIFEEYTLEEAPRMQSSSSSSMAQAHQGQGRVSKRKREEGESESESESVEEEKGQDVGERKGGKVSKTVVTAATRVGMLASPLQLSPLERDREEEQPQGQPQEEAADDSGVVLGTMENGGLYYSTSDGDYRYFQPNMD